MRRIVIYMTVGFIAGLNGLVYGDEIEELRQQMQNQYKAMQEIQNKLVELEKKQTLQDEQIKAAAASKETFKVPDTLKWAEKIKFYGDFRFRFDQTEQEKNSVQQKGQAKGMVRFRLGMTMNVNEDIDVHGRLASGSGAEPTSTNFTLGENWAKSNIWLERAYMDWHPKSIEGLHVLVGKMGMPFYSVNDLIWDSDVNPEGGAIQYTWKPSDTMEAFVNGGGFWVEESASDAEIALWAVQGGMKYHLNKEKQEYLTAGATYYDYANIQGDEIESYDGKSARGGNTAPKVGSNYFYDYDYNLVELFAEYGHTLFGLPSGLHAQYVNNMASGVSADTAWLIGYRLNKAKKAGSWQFTYDYREAQRDSMVGAFAETDFINGGVGGRGHRIGWKYQFTDNIQGGLYYFLADRARSVSTYGASDKADDEYQRIRAEMVITF